ncbi:hypothetical protein E3T55_15845 [Cryobacterium frigoriphilum]|uniref:Uncharacterized protein n=1 Tax=Cryobacterium frigoriphilum TaxID=1259150 RepID=A0A4V3IQJ7_9MICO|nr:hypothetical protein [Cryobacterium frigoriphilum]TFD47071.1 hypothetical protein E3T55_15845 [Cryobacterium frigoriphilum]
MTDSQRSDVNNGVHLCRNDAKLIDDDEIMYPVSLLQQWKARQIESALRAQQQGWRGDQSFALMDHTTVWKEVDTAGMYDHLRAAGMTSAWVAGASDDIATLFGELALNARQHAGSPEFTLRTSGQEVTVSYTESGAPFGRADLESVSNGNGGQLYLNVWVETWDAHFLFFSERTGNVRTWVVRNRAVAPDQGDRCAVLLPRQGRVDIAAFEGCETAQIHLMDRLVFSDMPQLIARLSDTAKGSSVLLSSEVQNNLRLIEKWLERRDPDFGTIRSWDDAIFIERRARPTVD